MKIAMGNDHAAVEMKQEIQKYLEEKGYEIINFGTDSHESCNYPEYGHLTGKSLAIPLNGKEPFPASSLQIRIFDRFFRAQKYFSKKG